MHTGMSRHVVSLAGISEEVGLGAGFYTGVDELQCVLRNNRRVVHADDDLQFAFEGPMTGMLQVMGSLANSS